MLNSNLSTDDVRTLVVQRPRASSLSAAMLARVFYQPSLVYFQAVAQDLSVRAASRRLSVASSAVTRQVAQLEDALGIDLFYRQGQRLTLTSAGRALFHHVTQSTKPLEAAMAELEGLRRLASGTISIAVLESVGMSIMPSLVAGFSRLFPHFRVRVVLGSSDSVLDDVRENRADFGLGLLEQTPEDIAVVLDRAVAVGVLVGSDHPLARLATVRFDDITKFPCALVENGVASKLGLTSSLFGRLEKLPIPVVQSNSVQVLVGLAKIGPYVGITTSLAASAEIDDGQLVFRPFSELDINRSRLGLITRANSTMSEASRALLDFTATFIRSFKLQGDDG